MAWKDVLRADPTPWLLEPDSEQPGVRYFALRDLLDRPPNDPQLVEAKRAVMATGPVPVILAAQNPEGYWLKPGGGYTAKYRSTVWQVMYLAQFGADGSDPRVRAGCEYLLSQNLSPNRGICIDGRPSYFIHCMSGNLSAAIIDLGMSADRRVIDALDFQARMVTGDGIEPSSSKAELRFYKSSTTGPGFACAANYGEPCAWGAVKAMLAFGKMPVAKRTPAISQSIASGVRFLLGTDPAEADYPHPRAPRPSRSWFQFGYPIGYVTDLLQNVEALQANGLGRDSRLDRAIKLIVGKQDGNGRWAMEYTYNGKTWTDIEKKGQPSKWVTLRALRALKASLA